MRWWLVALPLACQQVSAVAAPRRRGVAATIGAAIRGGAFAEYPEPAPGFAASLRVALVLADVTDEVAMLAAQAVMRTMITEGVLQSQIWAGGAKNLAAAEAVVKLVREKTPPLVDVVVLAMRDCEECKTCDEWAAAESAVNAAVVVASVKCGDRRYEAELHQATARWAKEGIRAALDKKASHLLPEVEQLPNEE